MLAATVKTRYWHKTEDNRVQCDLCPRACKLRNGQRGLCFVRACEDDQIVLTTYGRSSGFCIDPIEKKPLNHFYPGSSVLSFGTAGCNLSCKFCQNWDISKSRQMDSLSSAASPQQLAQAAAEFSCKSIAYTYNDPVIFHEYAIDVAQASKEENIKAVAVTAGYICPEPRREFFNHMDAANIDLKAFTEKFYYHLCGGKLADILDTILYVKHETNTWLELTTLLIPGENDSRKEIEALSRWIMDNLGPDIPLHFTAFHPDFKMREKSNTSTSSLTQSREIALNNGLHHVYTGNVSDAVGGSTYCANCNALLIKRDRYQLGYWHLNETGQCKDCGHSLQGHFDKKPGSWGPRRQLIRFSGNA
jgi:pyruvate formate lyase activating enzyme